MAESLGPRPTSPEERAAVYDAISHVTAEELVRMALTPLGDQDDRPSLGAFELEIDPTESGIPPDGVPEVPNGTIPIAFRDLDTGIMKLLSPEEGAQ